MQILLASCSPKEKLLFVGPYWHTPQIQVPWYKEIASSGNHGNKQVSAMQYLPKLCHSHSINSWTIDAHVQAIDCHNRKS